MARFVLKHYPNGRHYWHMVANNGKIVCWSGEDYSSRQAAIDTVEFVRSNAENSPVVEE